MKLIPTAIALFLSMEREASAETHLPSEVDVVIIGAGAAGLSAAARLEEFAASDRVSYVVLEAQGKVGGRVQSRKLDFGDFFGNYTVEEGANWITDFPGNPIFELAQEYEIGMVLQEFFDIDAYQNGNSITTRTMASEQKEFVQSVELPAAVYERAVQQRGQGRFRSDSAGHRCHCPS